MHLYLLLFRKTVPSIAPWRSWPITFACLSPSQIFILSGTGCFQHCSFDSLIVSYWFACDLIQSSRSACKHNQSCLYFEQAAFSTAPIKILTNHVLLHIVFTNHKHVPNRLLSALPPWLISHQLVPPAISDTLALVARDDVLSAALPPTWRPAGEWSGFASCLWLTALVHATHRHWIMQRNRKCMVVKTPSLLPLCTFVWQCVFISVWQWKRQACYHYVLVTSLSLKDPTSP